MWGGRSGGWSNGKVNWSQEGYVEKIPRYNDLKGYSAAGLLPWKKDSSGETLLLLSRERPWNSHTNDYDPVCWQIIGGKRQHDSRSQLEVETSPHVTGIRIFSDTLGGVSLPKREEFTALLQKGFCLWYPRGKYCLSIFEVTNDSGISEDIVDQFKECREKNPPELFPTGEKGKVKWVKNIDGLEWVPAGDILEAKFELSDLLQNVTGIDGFHAFLKGTLDLSAFGGSAALNGNDAGGKNGDKGKGKDKGKGWDKGGKGSWGKGGDVGWGKGQYKGGYLQKGMPKGSYGKGYVPSYGNKGNAMVPPSYGYQTFQGTAMMYQQPPEANVQYHEMQRQLIGEQLYVLVQPMAPTAFIAQKIAGMLLELPQSELLPLVQDSYGTQAELKERVQEAIEILRKDGLIE